MVFMIIGLLLGFEEFQTSTFIAEVQVLSYHLYLWKFLKNQRTSLLEWGDLFKGISLAYEFREKFNLFAHTSGMQVYRIIILKIA